MKTSKILSAICMILCIGLFTQCEKRGGNGGMPPPDDDSDRPEWAGGNTDANDHIKGNDDSGTTRGGEYGDLYILLRDEDGVPEMTQIGEEWYVQPIDSNGDPVELNEEGEVVNPEEAQEVGFGRLNIVRSPPSVLDQAFEEALKVLAAPGAIISLDFCGRLTSTYPDGDEIIVKTIDSPRENMSIYRYIMNYLFEDVEANDYDNRLGFLGDAPYNFDPLTIAASCFAAGSDKTGTVDEDEVVYINGFMDCIGLNPILNEHEYDFNNDQKYYFDFSEPRLGAAQFQYNRNVYGTRWLNIITLNGDGTWDNETVSVLQAMEDRGLFTTRWGTDPDLMQVAGFACAIDDAVQILDFVHGDSNITFLPDHE